MRPLHDISKPHADRTQAQSTAAGGIKYLHFFQTSWPARGCRDAEIPPLNIARNLVPLKRGEAGPTRQKVNAFCDHCNVIYELTRELCTGRWVLVSGVEVISDAGRIASFKRRMSLLKGDIQVDPKTLAKDGK